MTVIAFKPRKALPRDSQTRFKDRIHFDKDDISPGTILSKHYRLDPVSYWEVLQISSYYREKRAGLKIFRPGDKRKSLRKVDAVRHLSDRLTIRNTDTGEAQHIALAYIVTSAIWRLR